MPRPIANILLARRQAAIVAAERFWLARATFSNTGGTRFGGRLGDEGVLLFDRHGAEVFEQPALVVVETIRLDLRDDRPRMALQDRREPHEPVGCKLPLAKLEVADLLVGGSNPSRQLPEREPARLP